jgi:hypothetical protein
VETYPPVCSPLIFVISKHCKWIHIKIFHKNVRTTWGNINIKSLLRRNERNEVKNVVSSVFTLQESFPSYIWGIIFSGVSDVRGENAGIDRNSYLRQNRTLNRVSQKKHLRVHRSCYVINKKSLRFSKGKVLLMFKHHTMKVCGGVEVKLLSLLTSSYVSEAWECVSLKTRGWKFKICL